MSFASSSQCGSSNGVCFPEKKTRGGGGGGDRRKACDESKLCCRLIALHNKPLQKGAVGSLYIRRGLSVSANCLGESDVGENVKCRFFLVPSAFSTTTTTTTAEPRAANAPLLKSAPTTSTALEGSNSCFDLFVCFNWYSPQTVWQKVSSAYDMAFLDPTSHSQLLAYHGKRARWLFEHPSSQAILQKYLLSSRGKQTSRREGAVQPEGGGLQSDKRVAAGCDNNEQEEEEEEEGRGREKKKQPSGEGGKDAARLRSSQKEEEEKEKKEGRMEEETNGWHGSKKESVTSAEDGVSVRRVVLSGFSQGAAFAHGFALLLKEETKALQPMRVIGFGPPRFSFHSFRAWYDEHLGSDSFNVVLADEDPDGQHPVVFDPVCVCGVDDARVAEQPNLYVLEQHGELRRFSAEDQRRMLDMAPSVQVSKRSVIWNLMTRLSLVSSDYSKLFDQMHNIIAYYERLTAQPPA